MTFPISVVPSLLKDTTKDELVSPQFYVNGVDFNTIFSELIGIETQLGPTRKGDITTSGSVLTVAGPAQVVIGGSVVSFAGDTINFVAPGVTFVWIDQAGTLQNGATLPVNDNYLPVAQVTHGAGGAISGVVDLRPWLTGTGSGGSSFPANFKCTTSERRYARRDVVVSAGVDFLPAGITPLSSAAYWDIEITSSVNAVLTLKVIEGGTPTTMVIGSVVAGEAKRFYRVQTPKNFDGPSVDLTYQLQLDQNATVEFLSITEVEFDADCVSTAAATGLTLLPFRVPFTFGTASPLILFNLLAGDIVTECEVSIETPFDDPASQLKVGVTGALDAILTVGQIDPDAMGQYSTLVNRTSAIAENLLLTLTPAAATVGSGYVSGTIMR